MQEKKALSVFWFRRDLRLNDNTGLINALQAGLPVLPVFIFDTNILQELPRKDARVEFILNLLKGIDAELKQVGSSLKVYHTSPENAWKKICEEFEVRSVYFNHDYEPYAQMRDSEITSFLNARGITTHSFKDHVFFEKDEIVKADGLPYTVYTPYKNKWLEKFKTLPKYQPVDYKSYTQCFHREAFNFPSLAGIGFEPSGIQIPDYNLKQVKEYDKHRDFPAEDKTTYIGHHLRFGSVSVRSVVQFASQKNSTFLSEIIWRDFFSQILYHFPHVVNQSFKKQYDYIQWENDPVLYEKWCKGETGYPIVDAGMRQLNQTGFMHNRVRMIVASFLVKHLLIDWRWGEAYFAEKLLDFDLASNNGNWQWAAGCGCDAAPYFRVFSPAIQAEKFDANQAFVRRWIPGYDPKTYLPPVVDHAFARNRAIARFKEGILAGEQKVKG